MDVKRYKGIVALEKAPNGCVATIGNFDGVHIGHQEIIKRVVERARALGVPAAAVTFRPHPQIALNPAAGAHLLNSYEEKLRILESLGLDLVIEEPFSREFSNTTPEQFFRDYLLRRLNVRFLYLGYDFVFGKERAGSLELLHRLAEASGVGVEVVPAVKLDGAPVSSTSIRQALEAGDIVGVNRGLGREFFIHGIIQKGDGRGRKIGFPTANVSLELRKFPRLGVYVTKTAIRGKIYPSITNVGRNPTFKGESTEVPVMVETHILDFDQDIYGEEIIVAFQAFLRDEKRFNGVEELVAQIRLDLAQARKNHGLTP